MKKRLTHIFIEEGKVTKEQVEKAFILQMRRGGRIGSNLVQLGFITEEDLARALSRLHMKPFAPSDSFKKIDKKLKEIVPPDVAQKYRAIPIKEKNRTLIVAMESPDNLDAINELEFITDRNIIPWVCPQIRLEAALEDVYGIKSRFDFDLSGLRKAGPVKKKGEEEERRGFISIEERLSATEFGDAVIAMGSARSIKEVGEAVVTRAGRIGKRAILFVLKSREAILAGWKGCGGGLNDFIVRDYRIEVEELRELIDRLRMGNYYYGEKDRIPGSEILYQEIFSPDSNFVLFCPLFLRGRMLFLLYVDNGQDPFDRGSIEALLALSRMASMIMERELKDGKG